MLEGVVPFPPDFARRYREKGYWQDKSLAQEFRVVLQKYADRIAVIDGARQYTYCQLDEESNRLALNLLDLGLQPLDRVVVQLPNVAEFVILYLALQKIGCIPIAALSSHRFLEVSQFVSLSGAVACVSPEKQGEFDFQEMIARVQQQSPCLKHGIILGTARQGFQSLRELISKTPTRGPKTLEQIQIDPTDPAVFQLSGGTTGVPKLIPRTHNDYAYNSKIAAKTCRIEGHHVLLVVLPIAHNLPLACPGIQGFMFQGAKVVLSASTRPQDICAAIQEHGVTHIKVVPALLIRLLNDPSISKYDLSSLQVIQSGGQRLQPEVRLLARKLIPNAFIQENFGMGEGMLFFVRHDDPEDVRLETVGSPVCEDDEVRIVDEDGIDVPFGETGEMWCRGPYTLRGYFGVPEYNKTAFTPDGFYKSGDLMRQHPSGRYMVEGRRKDLINRGGEKISAEEIENLILSHPSVKNVACVPIPDPDMGERMCACVVLHEGASLDFDSLKSYLIEKEIAKYKLPERLEIMDDFPLSTFGKVSKKKLREMITEKINVEQRGQASAAQ
ncbi:MAG TPA: AMP-binding protein [Pusillimonas sp.]|uniref:(2,3-dihydroxybenzoyl)adenylate synthase n=1 Tax=unclassified Pusillimonas TaxID=2640016 RepID=UPI00260ABE6E|nr:MULTISPECIES: AMP-binding protein [unclassified Pusillimonas]HLU20197.1 AMP-binding protein [Pusillimonas sp.]